MSQQPPVDTASLWRMPEDRLERRVCPKCGERTAVPIAYGFPGDEMREGAERGAFVLGGCCIDDAFPTWHCTACEHRFGRLGDRMRGP